MPVLISAWAVTLWTQEPADRPADALVGRLGAVDALVERRLAELAGER